MSGTHPTYRRSPEVVAASLGSKSFLLHVSDWIYLELNDSGSAIWALLEEEPALETITEKLLRDFEVDTKVCFQETSEFLQVLEQKHFVIVKETHAA